jgi:hypothetical protein
MVGRKLSLVTLGLGLLLALAPGSSAGAPADPAHAHRLRVNSYGGSTSGLAASVGTPVTGAAPALPIAEESVVSGVTIPYPGRLSDEAGQPVAAGTYDFTFTLYGAETGGEALWSEVQEDVAVAGGLFNAVLGSAVAIPLEVVDGEARWLEVAVRGPDEAAFTALTPRQQLSAVSPESPAAPANGGSCPHSHWGETWEGATGWLYLHNTGTGNRAWLPGPLSGVAGSSDAWIGVVGKSTSNYGVLGQSTSDFGVSGESTNSYGGFFKSGNDHLDLALGGAIGRLNSDPNSRTSELWLSSNADVVVILDNDGGRDHKFRVRNSGHSDVFTCDEFGNCSCTGAKPATVKTADYGWRQLYSIESSEVWFEEIGNSSLVDGEATVAFDPIFLQTVNLEEDYHVFVTPLCDEPAFLFVTDKSSAGFTVKGVALDGEPSGCDFDYRVAVKRLGYEDLRLEETTWQEGE